MLVMKEVFQNLIKNYLRSTMSTLRLTNLANFAIENDINVDVQEYGRVKDFALKKARKVHF